MYSTIKNQQSIWKMIMCIKYNYPYSIYQYLPCLLWFIWSSIPAASWISASIGSVVVCGTVMWCVRDACACGCSKSCSLPTSLAHVDFPEMQGIFIIMWQTNAHINVIIENEKIILSVCHKVNDFNFEVINFPFSSTNIDNITGIT